MQLQVRLDEVLTPALLAQHQQHIIDFLALEGIAADPVNLGATRVAERTIKELLDELADS